MARLVSLLLAPAVLAGCAAGINAPPPILTYAGRNCADAPDLAGAVSLTPEERRAHHMIATAVDGATPCLRNAAGETPYVLYALPASEVRMVEVGSQLEFARIFSPQVVLLDQDGNLVRTFAADQFLYRGPFLSVQFVPRPEERFILVTADPARIGQSYDAVAISTSTTAVYTGFGVATWTSGNDQNTSRTFSYEGSVMAAVHSVEGDGS